MPGIDIPHKVPGDDILAREINEITRNINALLGTKGPNTLIDSSGVHQRKTIPKNVGLNIAKVTGNATGGGYYNCTLQTLDATDWDTTQADQLDDKGDSVVVLNLAEIGTSIHNLDAGDLILCQYITDDEGNTRLVGNEVFGRHTFGEW